MKKLMALAAAASLSGAMWAADHREAPAITEDPEADINDVYVFGSPGSGSRVVLAMTVNPLINRGNQTAAAFSPDVRYRFNIDSTGDSVADVFIDVFFTPVYPGPQRFRAVFPNGVVVEGDATRGTHNPAPNAAVIAEGPQGIKVFAGIRDDPFFFDLPGFNRFLGGGQFRKIDSFAGTNIFAIVVEVPVTMLLAPGGRTPFQIWGETDRPTYTVRGRPGIAAGQSSGPWRQVERMGNPAISTVLISSAHKDLFNLGVPKDDAAAFGPEFSARLQQLGTNATNISILRSVAMPDTLKFDPTLPTAFPNGRALADDVIDTLLFLIMNQPDPATASDGVPSNDVPFLDGFPYFAPPHQP